MSKEKINLNSFANSFLNASFKKKVVAGLLIIGMILAIGYTASQGVQWNISLELQARLDYLEVQQQLLNDTINIPVNSTISAMVKTCSYIVSVHDSYYCLINGSDDRAGRLEYYGTNASAVGNFALGNLTHAYPETVISKGNIVITAPLEAYSNTTFINQGIISQPANSNFKMFKNIDQVNGNVYIDVSGGKWLGGYNNTAFTSGVGLFDFRCTNLGSVTKHVSIHDLKVGNSPNSSICLYNVVRADIHNIWQIADNTYPYAAKGDYRSFFYFEYVSDSKICDNIGTSTQITFNFQHGSANLISGNYIAGGGYLGGVAWYMNGVNYNEISDNHIDYVFQGGIKFQDCQNNKITDLSITSPNSNSYPAIEMASSYNSTFTNVFIGQPNSMSPGSGANTAYGWSYGIRETGDSGSNIYDAMTITNCTTAYSIKPTSNLYDSTFNGQPIGQMHSYSYLISVSGSTYSMKNGATGQIDFSSTNASQVANFARGNLTSGRTWYENIVLKGNITLDSPILLDNWTELSGPATIWMGAGMRKNIIQNLDRTTVGNAHIYVHDLTFHGLYDDYSGQGNAIDFYNPTSLSGYDKPFYKIERCQFIKTSNYSISVYNVLSIRLFDIQIKTSSKGIMLHDVADSFIERIDPAGIGGVSLVLMGGATNHLTDVYLAGSGDSDCQLLIENSGDNLFSNLRIDYTGCSGMIMNDTSDRNEFSNFQITQAGLNINATYNGITISGGSYNKFSNGAISRKGNPIYLHYGVLEFGSSNCNTFCMVDAIDVADHGIVTAGTASHANLCWNATTWLP